MTIRIVAIGGTVNPGSSTEQALRLATRPAIEAGAEVRVFGGDYLATLAHYRGTGYEAGNGGELVEAVRAADGLIIAAPGYHGTISGLVKNALDYIEDLRTDTRPYLDGRAIGCIACAAGPQATGPVLAALRAIAHALRGWPTPLGIAATSYDGLFDANGVCTNDALSAQLKIMATQVFRFASSKSTPPLDAAS